MAGPNKVMMVAAVTVSLVSAGTFAQVRARPSVSADQQALQAARNALAAKLGEIRITPAITLAQVTGADRRVEADMLAFLAKLRPAGRVRRYADGSAEVDLEVAVKAALTALRDAVGRRGGRVTPDQIDARIEAAGDQVVRVVGAAGGVRTAAQTPQPIRSGSVPGIWLRYCDAKGRSNAAAAATADARRNLMRAIQRLTISDGVKAAELMNASGPIRTGMTAWVAKLSPTGSPRYRDNELIVDVTIQVATTKVMDQLKRLYQAHAKGRVAKAVDFSKPGRGRPRTLRATGSGAPPEQLKVPARPTRRPAQTLTRPKWPKTLRATAISKVDPSARNVGQAKLLALRRAEQVARKRLARQVEQLRVGSAGTVKQFIASAGAAAAGDVNTYLSGARVTRSQVTEGGQAEAAVEITTDRLWKIISFWRQRTD